MVGNRVIEIVFIGKTAFPVSTASSNRIFSLSKGLVKAGAKVSVYCFGLTKYSSNNYPILKKGTIDSVYWEYTSLRVSAFKNRLLNGIFLLLGQFIGYFLIIIRYYNKKPFFFTSQSSFGYIFPLWAVTRICGGKLLFFRSELPKYILNKSPFRYFHEQVLNPIVFRFFDGMFIMTNNLKEYFEKWGKDKSRIQLTPLTIDFSLFEKKLKSPYPFPYIAYCGSLSFYKDGIDILIKAFGLIEKKYPALRLVIIGRSKSEQDFENMKTLVSKSIEDSSKVIFTGFVDKELIPQYLNNAELLALARPDSIQAQGGFPSKLGEYLATDRPVVVTATGEIKKYLSDLENARIAIPGDVDDFSEKLEWVLNNQDLAVEMGKNGKLTALNNFSNLKVGKDIYDHLNDSF